MIISVDKLKAGDKLIKDVINLNGTQISSAGATVTEVLLLRFKTWSIKEVEIESEKSEPDAVKHLTNEDFATLGINPIMDKILTIAERIKSQRVKNMAVK